MDNIPFMERLQRAVQSKGGPVVVGLDPRPEWFPPDVRSSPGGKDRRRVIARDIVRFNELILDAIHDVAVAVKPQLAFYERWGWPGMQALEQTITLARQRGLLVIMDGKRNDIGSTAEAYARAYLGGNVGPVSGDEGWDVDSGLEADALTVNPYLGTDGLDPFIEYCRQDGKGIFVLLRTSNPSADELQGLVPADGSKGEGATELLGSTVAERVARIIVDLNESLPKAGGYGPVGAVVGATRPEEARVLRRRLPGVMLLVPGYGAQGASGADARAAFDETGQGAVVNSSRGILYAWRRERPGDPGTARDFAAAARRAALAMQQDLQRALGAE